VNGTSGITVAAGAIFNINNVNLDNSNAIQLSGTLSGTGSVTISNPINLQANSSIISAPNNTDSLNLSGNINNSTFNVSFAGAGTITQASTSVLGNGSGGLTMSGTGTVILNGANTYTGATAVNSGTLSIGSTGALGASSSITVDAGATLDFNFATAGTLGNTNTIILGATCNNGCTTNTNILTISSGSNVNPDVINNNITLEANVSLGGSGVGILGGALNDQGDTFGIIKTGSGTITLNPTSGVNTYAGGTIVSAGTLITGKVGALGSSGSIIIAPTSGTATLDLSGLSGALSNTGTIALDSTNGTAILLINGTYILTNNVSLQGIANDLTVNSGTVTFSGIISDGLNGSGMLTKQGAGTLILSNANTYSGGTEITNGILQTNVSSVLNGNNIQSGSLGLGSVIIDSGSTLVVNNVSLANTLSSLNGSGFIGTAGALVGEGANAAWTGSITLDSDATIGVVDANTNFTLGSATPSTISGAHNLRLGLTPTSPATTVPGTITLEDTVSTLSLTANVANLNLATSSISTQGGAGNQTYNSAVSVLTDAQLSAHQGAILFNSTVDGSHNLALATTLGTTLNGAVGSNQALGSLTLSAVSGTPTDTLNASITTSGANSNGNGQEYDDAVNILQSLILNSGANAIVFAKTLTDAANTAAVNTHNLTLQSIAGSTGNVSFNGRISLGGLTPDSGAYAVNILGGGSIFSGVTFNNSAGVVLNSLPTQTFAIINGNLVSTASSTTIQGNINVAGSTTLGAVTVTSNANSIATNVISGTTLSLGAIIGTVVNSNIYSILNLNASSGTTLNGNVSNINSLSLSGGGTDVINATNITTTGSSNVQVYNDPVQLEQQNVTLSAASIAFTSTINNFSGVESNLNIQTSSGANLQGAINVGSLTLGSISGNINDNGGDIFSGSTITTQGNQVYNDALIIGSDTILTSTAGNISLASGNGNSIQSSTVNNACTVNNVCFSLTLNVAGTNSVIAGILNNLNTININTSNINGSHETGTLILSGADLAIAAINIGGGTVIAENPNLGEGMILVVPTSGTGYQVGDLVTLVDQTHPSASGSTGVVKAQSNGVPTLVFSSVGTGYVAGDTVVLQDNRVGYSGTAATTRIIAVGNSPITVSSGATLELLSTHTGSDDQFVAGYPGQSLTLAGTGFNNQGALFAVCSAGSGHCGNGEVWAGNVSLASATTINSNDILTFSGTGSMNGASNNLTFGGSGVVVLDGPVNNVNTLVVNSAAGIVFGNGGITTIDGQTYNSILGLQANTTLITVNGNITINGGVEGNISQSNTQQPFSLTLVGESANTIFTLGGPSNATPEGYYDVGSITVTGLANGNDTLILSTADSQLWTINQNNGGTIVDTWTNGQGSSSNTHLNFTNIANPTGGSANVRFVFDGAPVVSGAVNGGTNNATMQKIVDYSTYGIESNNTAIPVTVSLSSANAGTASVTSTGTMINKFSNVNDVVGAGTGTLSLTSLQPQSPTPTVNITGPLQGNINGGTNFKGFNNIIGAANVGTNVNFPSSGNGTPHVNLDNGTVTEGGVTIQITNMNINSISGSFIPELLPVNLAAIETMYAYITGLAESIAEDDLYLPNFRDNSLLSIDMPSMNVVGANIAQIMDGQKMLDEQIKTYLLKTAKKKTVYKPVGEK